MNTIFQELLETFLSGSNFALIVFLSDPIRSTAKLELQKMNLLLQSYNQQKIQEVLACWMFRESLVIVDRNEEDLKH